MELKKLVKNTSFLAGTRVFQFIAGIFRSKINAVFLGTTGLGIVNQLTFLTSQLSSFTMLSMSEAVVKQIAESKDDDKLKELVCASLKSYIVLVFSFMVLSIIVFALFAQELTNYVLGDIKYLPYFYIGLFSFPILILNSIPFAILKGFKDVKAISFARVGIIISNLIVFIPLVLFYKLKGAVVFIPLSYIITLCFNYFVTRKNHLLRLNIGLKTIINARIKERFVKELLLFSGFGLVVGSYGIISEFICRSIVIDQLGVDSIGLYSPIVTWSGLFIGFIIPSFSTYLYPRFAETKSNAEISGILNDAIRLSTFLLMPLIFLAIPYREFFINLFYSNEFIDAEKYLPYHFIGLIFYVWWYILAISLTPTGNIKFHSIFMILFYSLNILVVYYLVPYLGLYGWMLKHIISPVIFLIVLFFFLRKEISFIISFHNIILMVYILATSTVITISINMQKDAYIGFILGPLLLGLALLLLNKSEKAFLKTKLRYVYKAIA